jgi:hypothetical protein
MSSNSCFHTHITVPQHAFIFRYWDMALAIEICLPSMPEAYPLMDRWAKLWIKLTIDGSNGQKMDHTPHLVDQCAKLWIKLDNDWSIGWNYGLN